MSRRLLTTLAISATFALAACSGGAAITAAPTGAPAASSSAAAGGGGAVCAASNDAGAVQATMSGVAFVPGTIAAKVGEVITWKNDDQVLHTATFKDDPACTTPTLDPGATGGLTFSAPGTYPLICKIHSNMAATIEVTS
jgi:plastocyanin